MYNLFFNIQSGFYVKDRNKKKNVIAKLMNKYLVKREVGSIIWMKK